MAGIAKETRSDTLRQYLVGRWHNVQKQIDHLLAEHREDHIHFREDSVLDAEDMSLRDSTGAQQIALLEARTKERNQLEAALRRLDEGAYGVCEDCTAAIPQGRLRALPFARRCVECQKAVEAFERIIQREDRDELQPIRSR